MSIAVCASTVDVTPDAPVPLGASDNRKPFLCTSVASRLEANLVRIGADQNSVVLLCLDALFIGPDLVGDLERELRLGGVAAIPAIVAVATHTHFAPMPDRTKPRLGAVDATWYRDLVVKLGRAIFDLCARPGGACRIATASGPVAGAINRRRHIRRPVLNGRRLAWNETLMRRNPAGPRDDRARLAVFFDERGNALAALVTWACHPSSWPYRDQATSEFIGQVRTALRRRLGDTPVLFLQGFCGDVRADIPTAATPGRLLQRLMAGPVFVSPTQSEWHRWAQAVGEHIGRLAEQLTAAAGSPAESLIVHRTARLPLGDFLDRAPAGRALEARYVAIGPKFELFFLSAEPVADHAAAVLRAWPAAWPIGYLGDVFGYFPTDAQIPQGGYEVDGFRELFGLDGRFRGSTDTTLAKLIGMLKQRT